MEKKTNNKFYLECVKCGKHCKDPGYLTECPDCAGVLIYRYFNKGRIREEYGNSVWRYLDFLPLEKEESMIDIGVYRTPLIKSHHIAGELGLKELYIKDETKNPTGTFKDREAFINVSRFKELGYKGMVMASTGHSGLAHARAWIIAGGEMQFFVPKGNVEKWESMVDSLLKKEDLDFSVIKIDTVEGSCLDGIGAARWLAKKKQFPLEMVFQNQIRAEGMKTLAFEVIEELGGAPDWYIQTVGSGVGIFSFNKACSEMGYKGTRFAGIQAKGCAPMVKRGNITRPDTYAIGVANPYLYLSFSHLRKLGTVFEEAFSGGKESEKNEIPRLLEMYKTDGIMNPGIEAAIELSGLEKLVQKGVIKKDEKIVLCCSGELKDKLE